MSPCELWTFFDRHSDPPPLLRLPDPLVLPTSSPNFPTCQDELDSFRMNSKQLIVGWWCVYVSKITIIYIYIHYMFKLNTFDCSLLQCLTEALKTKLSKLFKKHTFENSDVKSNQINVKSRCFPHKHIPRIPWPSFVDQAEGLNYLAQLC